MSRKRDTRKYDELRLRRLKAFGGPLLRKAKYRTSRPITTKSPMHLILKSSKAKGSWSFLNFHNHKKIRILLIYYARKYRVQLRELSFGQQFIHMNIQVKSRKDYLKFIRVSTCAIAMKIAKVNRLNGAEKNKRNKLKFWDFRPLTAAMPINLSKLKIGLKQIIKFAQYLQMVQSQCLYRTLRLDHLEGEQLLI